MSRGSRKLVLTACMSALCALALLTVPVADASTPRQIRVGAVPGSPVLAKMLGALSGTTRLDVAVTLKPRDAAALAAYATEVSTPGSPTYHDYLSTAQFAQRFGPSQAQIGAVESSLRAQGLTPGKVTANGLAIPVSATAGLLSSAFSIAFNRLQLPSGRIAFANNRAPLFDSSVAGIVQGVVGLDTLSVPQPLAVRSRASHAVRLTAPHVATGGPQPCAAASTAAPGQQAYTTDQIASAYQFSSLYGAGDFGAGVTIAIYELEPDSPSDIAAYQSCYGTDASVSYTQVDGGAGQGAGSGEAALDIENVIGLAPKANIIVYQGPNSNSGAPGAGPYDTYAQIIMQDQAKVISTSWGQCEPMEGAADAQAENTLFQEAATQGQTILSASGDSGAQDCYVPGQNLNLATAVDDPASQPYVTGVGGTSMASPGPPPKQTVWNNGSGLSALLGASAGAGGGGVSTLWPMPSYQSAAPRSLNVINSASGGSQCGASGGYCREVPDVSADADPFTGYLIYWNGSWGGIGGTSAAAPVWAALVALADASPACSGTSVGFANPALYRAASGSSYGGYFDDVTSGSNDFSGTNGGQFTAGPGYDMATGLGTPIASALAVTLCETVTVTNPGAQSSTLGRRTSVRIMASDAGGSSLSYHASGLPAGLSINRSTGLITGTPTQGGVSTVVVRSTDSGGRTGTATFKWTIRYPTVLSASPPVAKCSQLLRRRDAGQSGVLRLTGSLGRGSVAVLDARGTLVSIDLAAAKVTVRAGGRVLGTVTSATGGLHVLSRSADQIELVSGDHHFRLVVGYAGARSSVVVSTGLVCSYAAPRTQTLAASSGRQARGTLYLVTTTGAALSGARIAITDGHRQFSVRTGRSGTASFSLAAGPGRSVRAAYAGGSDFVPAGITFRIRDR